MKQSKKDLNIAYGALAEKYDIMMCDVDYEVWGKYLIELLNGFGVVSDAKLLEYGCGTGNLTEFFLKNDYSVIAVDKSEEMLSVAAQKFSRSVNSPNMVCADMRDFSLNYSVDAAVCACDGVNYILEEADLRRYFKAVYRNTKPGALFLFDISSYYKLSQILGNELFFDDAENYTLFWENNFDKKTEIVKMTLALFEKTKDEYYIRRDELHEQKAWKIKELEKALNGVGFTNVESYAFGTLNAPDEKTERIQFVAERG